MVAVPDSLEQIIRDELRQSVEYSSVKSSASSSANSSTAISRKPQKRLLTVVRTARSRAYAQALRRKPAPAERRCNRCGETKPAGEYGRGRGTCRSCRRAQQREHDRRAALAEDEEPHSDGQGLSVDRWLLERGLAEQRGVALIATPAGRELGAALLD